MTRKLEKAFQTARRLTAREQDALADWLLEAFDGARPWVRDLSKHGVEWDEAHTILADPWAITILLTRRRGITIGRSKAGRILVAAHTEGDPELQCWLGTRPATKAERRQYEHPATHRLPAPRRKPSRVAEDPLDRTVDFRGGVRGKHLRRYREEMDWPSLDSDVAMRFASTRAVNAALRKLLPRKSRGSRRR